MQKCKFPLEDRLPRNNCLLWGNYMDHVKVKGIAN